MMEMVLTGFNYFSVGADYVYKLEMLNPYKAVSNFYLFLKEDMGWSQFWGVSMILLLLGVFFVFFYLLACKLISNINNSKY